MSVHLRVQNYTLCLTIFQEIQRQAGRMAEMLAYVADGMSHDPDEIDLSPEVSADIDGPLVIKASWPTLDELIALKRDWRDARNALRAAWARLNEAERLRFGDCPDTPQSGVLLPFV